MAWAKNGTPDTLGSAGDTLIISDQTSKTFNVILGHCLNTGGIQPDLRLGNGSVDTGNNYAYRYSIDGATDSTGTSQSEIPIINTDTNDNFVIYYIINISSEEKLVIGYRSDVWSAGAATAPARTELVGKWANTSDQFDNVSLVNTGAGSFNTSSNLSAIGTD